MKNLTPILLFSMFILLVVGCGTNGAPVNEVEDSNDVYIFVHGAFQDASSWDAVLPLIEANNDTAIAVNLPSHGNDNTPLGDVTLADYRETVINAIEQFDQPVILVGHSFGGITISEVAEATPDKVKQLIYVAAYIPKQGDTLAGIAELDQNNGFNEEGTFLLSEDFTYAYVAEEAQIKIFCGDCTAAQQDVLLASMQNEPLGPLNEPATVTAENFGSVPKAYIMTALDNAASPQIQAYMMSHTPVDTVRAINTSHAPFLTMPTELANLIIDVSN